MPSVLARNNSDRHASRASANRRRGGRADRDGDVSMDVVAKGRGRIGKSSAPNGPASTRGSRDLVTTKSRGSILSSNAQRAILRQAATGETSMKDVRRNAGGLEKLRVTGYEKSKASTNSDGGISSLLKWLEKKATVRLGSRRREVKIKKSQQEEDALIISVPPEDVAALVRMNGYVWAGATISIRRLDDTDAVVNQMTSTEKTKAMLRSVLDRRYNIENKFLDLSALGQDEELKAQAIFDTKSTASKFFPAMMKVLEMAFDTPQERDTAIESVSLAHNDLQDLAAVTSLSLTLPKLHNLDLSNNQFENLSVLLAWKRRFHQLQHLIVSNNPLEQNEPTYAQDFLRWYPNLRMLNNIQVRTEEEIAQRARNPLLPFPIRSSLFQDEGGIAENFVRTFFAGFDTDRHALVALYYDDASDFSFAVNTQAQRDPNNTESTEKQEWDLYIKSSRNLKKISQLPARQNRHFRGLKAIADAFAAMPPTKHPDLAAEAKKWLIEAHMQPGVPDPTGQSPSGVDGFFITVHGEFDEIDPTSRQTKKKRSFDHVFILGPGGSSGVRVHNHELVIRAYGGIQAFEPDVAGPDTLPLQDAAAAPNGSSNPIDAPPQLPAGLTLALAEQMVAQLQQQTAMTLQYAKDCLEQVGWDFPKALAAFQTVRANLPPDAFVAAGAAL